MGTLSAIAAGQRARGGEADVRLSFERARLVDLRRLEVLMTGARLGCGGISAKLQAEGEVRVAQIAAGDVVRVADAATCRLACALVLRTTEDRRVERLVLTSPLDDRERFIDEPHTPCRACPGR